MDIETIKRITKSHGYSVRLNKYEKHAGNMRSSDRSGHHVYVERDGVSRSIGKLELDVSKLDEVQILARIEAKFAQGAQKRGRTWDTTWRSQRKNAKS